MIFGFPGQIADTYIKNLERLLRSGVDRVYSYNLRLLYGIDLATLNSRKKYNFKTKFRLPERTYGMYDGTGVTETEEVVVGSNSFTFEDYQKVRKYCLFLEMASGRGYLSEFIDLMSKLGLPGEKIIAHFAGNKFGRYPKLRAVVKEYIDRARKELFDTPEECVEYVRGLLSEKKAIPEIKLNFIYTGKIMLDPDVRMELFDSAKDFIRDNTADPGTENLLIDYLDTILDKQVVVFGENEDKVIVGHTSIYLDRLKGDGPLTPDMLVGKERPLNFVLHKAAVEFIMKTPLVSVENDEAIQDIYMTVTRFGLLRLREKCRE
jgi:hypothetical protein